MKNEHLQTLLGEFLNEVRNSMQCIRLHPDKALVDISAIVGIVADVEGSACKAMLHGELMMSDSAWKKLISLKFDVTVDHGEQLTKQLGEGLYARNTKTPNEEKYLRSKIASIFKHRSKAHKHNARAAEGLAELAEKMNNLDNFYVVAQAATVDRIILNLPSIDRMLMKYKSNKEQEVWVIKDHSVQELVKETCMPLMKQE